MSEGKKIVSIEEYNHETKNLINEMRELIKNLKNNQDNKEVELKAEKLYEQYSYLKLDGNFEQLIDNCNFGIRSKHDQGWELMFDEGEFQKLTNEQKILAVQQVELNLVMQYEFGGDYGMTYQMQSNLLKDLTQKYSL